jgi:hypothetical protein
VSFDTCVKITGIAGIWIVQVSSVFGRSYRLLFRLLACVTNKTVNGYKKTVVFLGEFKHCCNFVVPIAEVAQLVERNLAKVKVAGSRPVFRSKSPLAERIFYIRKFDSCLGGGIGRHEGLKIPWLHGRTGSSPVSGTFERQIVRSVFFALLK